MSAVWLLSPKLYFPTILSTNSFTVEILCYQEVIDSHRRDPEPLLCALKKISPDYRTVVTRILADELLTLDITFRAVENYSLWLFFNVTSSFDIDLMSTIVEDLTCAKMMSSYCLKALIEPMSIYLSYPFVGLGNAPSMLCFKLWNSEILLHYVLGFDLNEWKLVFTHTHTKPYVIT